MKLTRASVSACIATALLVPTAAATASSNASVPVRGSTVKEFATRFEKTLGGVLDPLLTRLGRMSPDQGRREELVSMSLDAGGGTVRVQGLALLLPKPRRYDLTLRFDGVSQPGDSRRKLKIDGTLQFDFIAHGRGKADGLFRGVMNLGGRFRGDPEVYGEVVNGNIVSLVAESGGNRFRVGRRNPRPFLSYTGTLAGNGSVGDSDGKGRAARLSGPQGLAVAEDGTVYVADTDNDKIRKITPAKQVTTVVAGLDEPTDIGIDPFGDLIVSQRFSSAAPLGRVDPSSGEVTPIVFNRSAEGDDLCGLILGSCDGRSPIGTMQWPNGIDVQSGITYVAQGHYPASLRMVLPDGYVSTIRNSEAGGRSGGDCGNAGIVGGNADVAKGRNGEIFYLINQVGCYAVLALQPDGSVRTVAGKLDEYGHEDGIGEEARFFNFSDLVFDGIRYLYVSDSGNNLLRRVDVVTGEVLRVAGCIPHEPGFDCDGLEPLRDGAADHAQFYLPEGIALDEWGDLYVTEERNHAVRIVRIVTDPGREPLIDSFQPFAVEQGTTTTIEVKGRNLGLAESASLGDGVAVTLQNAGSRRLLLRVAVDPLAAPGPRTLMIETPYGTAQAPSNMSLEILEAGISGAEVTTIAGTGSWLPGIHDGPAERSEIGFAAGMDTIDAERVLVADTLEQRVRMIATKEGATDEVVALMLHASVERDTLDGILTGLDRLGQILTALGIENELDNATEASLNPIVSDAIDEWCNALDGDCRWLSLPWAGVPMLPGDSGGIRLQGRMFLPSDVVAAGPEVAYIADAGNEKLKVAGFNPGPNPGVEAPFQLFGTNDLNERPFTVASIGDNTALAGLSASSLIERVAMNGGGDETEYAGVKNGLRCIQIAGDARQPMGLPLGMDVTADATFVADAYCQTIWRIDTQTNEVTDMRGDARQDGTDIGACSDGPASFATFGAPMDVSVDPNGNIWVADAACDSIRVITDLNKDEETIAADLKDYLNGVAGHLPDIVADQIETKLDELDEEFLATNRWWVLTVAGNNAGDAGYADGPGAQALFNVPVGLEVIHKDGKTVVFVSDAGNHRIRMIEMPQL